MSSAIGDVLDLLPHSAEQAAAGMACGGVPAIAGQVQQLRTRRMRRRGSWSRRPAPATLNNPSRVAPRHLFDLGLGTETTYARQGQAPCKFIINLTNKDGSITSSRPSAAHFVALDGPTATGWTF